jgi:hypothetical protein
MTQTHSGRCACGAVHYRVQGQPVVSTVCHCTYCQRRLASAFAILVTFAQESVEITQGQLAECEHRSDAIGRCLKVQFCATCGTTISHTAEVRPGMRSIAGGTFDDPDWFSIDRHIWVQSKRPWVVIPAGMAAYQQGFVAGAPSAPVAG